MSQTIDIRTLAGVKIDTFENETIEVVMGGFSLLTLDQRSTSYSNEFQLPRTPNNETIFAFISQPTRNNKVVIDVIITCGLFQRVAKLTVLTFGTTYGVSVSYSGFIEAIRGVLINDLINDISQPLYNLTGDYNDAADYLSYQNTYPLFHSYSGGTYLKDQGAYINLQTLIEKICLKKSYTAEFEVGLDFTYHSMFLRDWYYKFTTSGFDTAINLEFNTLTQYKSISQTLKDVCALLAIYFDVNENTKVVSFKKITTTLAAEPTDIETLKITNKQIYSGYNLENKINYTTGEGILSNTKGGSFDGDGTSKSEVLKLNAVIPKNTSGKPDLIGLTDIVIAWSSSTPEIVNYTVEVDSSPYSADFQVPVLDFEDLSTRYSFLSDIFTAPVILDVDGYVDTLKANSIMQNKMIRSVALGGTFYVEAMNYNLNTGKTVMKLIKIQI